MTGRATPAVALALLAACEPALSDRELFVLAQQPDLPLDQASDHCLSMADPAESDACLLAVAGGRTEPAPQLCLALRSTSAAAECWFTAAERYAEAGDRWAALDACALAGPFTHECLYHAWTRELQAIGQGDADLPTALSAAAEPVAFWSQLETAGPGQPERVWGDFWYFWWLNHPPATALACEALLTEHREPCQVGTRQYVERSVDQALRDPSQAAVLDRSCRAGALPDFLPGAIAQSEPDLLEAAQQALDRLCSQGTESPRPWNPVFQPRRPR